MVKTVKCTRNGLIWFTKGMDYTVVGEGRCGYTLTDNRGKDVFADKVYFKELIDEEKEKVMTRQVKCIDPLCKGITFGKTYDVIEEKADFYKIKDDEKDVLNYFKERFVEVKEFEKPFPKTLSEKIAVMQAYESGAKIEMLNSEGWHELSGEPLWDWINYDYRVKEPEKPIKDTIDWSQVKDEFICHAFDENGEGNFFTEEPKIDYSMGWWMSKRESYLSTPFKSVKRGTMSWDKSLVFRPGKEKSKEGENTL